MSQSHDSTIDTNTVVSKSFTQDSKREESGETTRSRNSFFTLPKMLILIGAVLFIVSHFFIWWELKLVAPQFPGGLFIQATSYEIQDSPKTPFNDIREVDGLNHYIGMMSLGDAAQVEMAIAIPAIILFVALAIVALFWRNKWSPLLVIPIVLFPIVFIADLAYWLWYAGHNLDDTAAITLEPFTPVAVGTGNIAQFSTVAVLQPGWYLAAAAAVMCLAAIVLHFRRRKDAKQ